jgi:hypothetical protein
MAGLVPPFFRKKDGKQKMNDKIIIEYLEGECPLQGEGLIDGHRFYFRARWQHWELVVGPDDKRDPLFVTLWEFSEDWGDGPYDAGYMPADEGRRLIERGAAEFLAWKQTGRTAPEGPARDQEH